MKKHIVTIVCVLVMLSASAQGLLRRSRLGRGAPQMPTLTQADFEAAVEKAKANDPEALYTMAQVFAVGKLVPHDGKSAYAYLKESADAGFGKATLAIGFLEEYGCAPWQYQDSVAEYGWIDAVAHEGRINVGNSNDVARVTALYANAKAKGIEFAEVVRTNLLAKVDAHYAQERKRIAEEEQRKRNAEMALKALEAENPERQAQRRLRETGTSAKVTVENMMSLEEGLKKAEGGDVDAMYSLALRYLSGTDVKGNEKAVRKFLTGAAEKGHGGAQFLLGILCEHELEKPRSAAWQNNQSEDRMFKFTKANSVYFVSPFDEEKYLGGLLNSNTVSKMLGYYAAASSNAVPEAVEAYRVAKRMVDDTNNELLLKKANGEKLDAYFAATTPTNPAPVASNRPASRSSLLGRRNSILEESRQKAEKEREVKEDTERTEFYLTVSNHLAAAEAGNAEDQFWMAKFCRAYAQALPDKKIDEKYENAVKSLQWLTKAADAGHTNAMYSLGTMLINGDGQLTSSPDSAQVGLGGGSSALRSQPLLGGLRARRLGRSMPQQTTEEDAPIVLKPYQMYRSTFSPDFVYKRDVDVTSNLTGMVTHRTRSTTYRRLYKQDVARGLAYLKKSAAFGYRPAKQWFESRSKYGLPEDLPTWACATNTLSLPAVGQTFKLTVKSRPYDEDESVPGFYRNITIDSTGKTVEISAEFCTDPYDGPWHKPAKDVIIEE